MADEQDRSVRETPSAAAPAGLSAGGGAQERLDRRTLRLGIRLQVALRGGLVGFVIATLLLLPLIHHQQAELLMAACYLMAAVGSAWWLLSGSEPALRFGWVVLYLDLIVLTVLGLIAVDSAGVSWTSEVLLRGIFVLPVLAATELRPWVCASVAGPAVGLYLLISLLTQSDNLEPTASIVLRGVVMVAVAAAAVTLSAIQRGHVRSISGLAADRSDLLEELGAVEQRERQSLAEHLHDGALQYVLAARQDLAEGRRTGDAADFDRVAEALTQTSQLLRATVSDLHPAVLDRAGLPEAIRTLASAAAQRGRLSVEFDAADWPENLRTVADQLLYSAARELISNVVRHAGAQSMWITVGRRDGRLMVRVADDGSGVSAPELARRLAGGHIGMHSQRVRVEAGGGTMTITATGPAGGTTVTIDVPDPTPISGPAAVLVGLS